MLKVIAFRDRGWFFEKRTEYRLWDHLCRAYDVDFEFVNKIEEINDDIIIFDEDGDISLNEFKHPRDAVYVFGHTGQSLKHDFPNAVSVAIDTPKTIALFGAVACGIVLEDRKRKWQLQ